ncbi:MULTISPECIES: methylenetetrahydrofolate reductase [unclassified Crossiella]|uniref:methylenetetrahydrofolate reductase n=1 Tax=unclassified Crossiella TaxID=2620835 RepID=UPI001FFEA250|nr:MULTISPECIES: methylenetetrahydrofolate reductase [unclassified Crossiella]MCK2240164.1 methylenetetrahydrofolate reductase [Crossiella sp. S99.2]MCK2253384.1 methylenetetrahydrofolate reductase [Crossiella sp. S99.1]
MTSVVDRLCSARPSFSVEFFPPGDENAERQLWRSIRDLEPLEPSFVSVTYGAGGTKRDRTIRITGRIAAETTLTPVAHLTAVNHSIAELRNIIGWYASAGVTNVLALRGDPPGDPHGEWIPHPEGIAYAEDLVRLVRGLGDFCVSVACFPNGHPRSASLDADADFLVRKFEAGAQYAVSQTVFRVEEFLRLRDRVAARGIDVSKVPLLPGLMPITSVKGVRRMAELSGDPIPAEVLSRIDPIAEDPAAVREEGVRIATELSQRLLAEGVLNLHYYTLNKSTATREVLENLGLVPARA